MRSTNNIALDTISAAVTAIASAGTQASVQKAKKLLKEFHLKMVERAMQHTSAISSSSVSCSDTDKDEKLQDVLGHFQKDFEGGVSAENLRTKFGGYGSFLPTYQRSPGSRHNSVVPSSASLSARHGLSSTNAALLPSLRSSSNDLSKRDIGMSSAHCVEEDTRYPQVLHPIADAININNKIWDMYFRDLLTRLVKEGDDGNCGSAAVCDTICFALSKRIHYGKFVAEAKFRASPDAYEAAIGAQDRTRLMDLLTYPTVEEAIKSSVEMKAKAYGKEVTDNNNVEKAELIR
ncbi:unnamed protein product [Camellia sinensis]